MTQRPTIKLFAVCVASLLIASGSHANAIHQPESKPAVEPTTKPAAEPASEPASEPDDLPSLDELLGLEDEHKDTKNEKPIEDANDAALEKVLSPKEAGEAFSQAVSLMDQVAERLSKNNDLSITTQRLQEDILRKLDQVIESAKNNNSNGQGSSSSQSSSQNQQQPNQQQQQQEGEGSEPSSESGDASMPAGSSDAQPGSEVAPNGVSWGALPERIRDALSQGISDRYSELYRSLTEQYYKSLAEDEE
jgi:hypothetical protein